MTLTGKIQAFSIPFPPKELSPNSRLHWSKRNKAKKAYQRAVWAALKEQKAQRMADEVIDLETTFFPPGNYGYDDDNLIGRMKAARDTIAIVIGVDDKVFRQAQPVIEAAEPPAGRVQVVLRPRIVRVPLRGCVS